MQATTPLKCSLIVVTLYAVRVSFQQLVHACTVAQECAALRRQLARSSLSASLCASSGCTWPRSRKWSGEWARVAALAVLALVSVAVTGGFVYGSCWRLHLLQLLALAALVCSNDRLYANDASIHWKGASFASFHVLFTALFHFLKCRSIDDERSIAARRFQRPSKHFSSCLKFWLQSSWKFNHAI